MAALAAGGKRWQDLNVAAYQGQAAVAGGFWMSFHELTADYPWLTKRMAAVTALADNRAPGHPARNPFAWLLALFVPRVPGAGGSGGLMNMMIVVAIIGILAAIAIPAYQDYMTRAALVRLPATLTPILAKVQQHGFTTRKWPSAEDIGLEATSPDYGPNVASIALGENGVLTVTLQGTGAIAGKTIVYTPAVKEDHLEWTCASPDLRPAVLGRLCSEPTITGPAETPAAGAEPAEPAASGEPAPAQDSGEPEQAPAEEPASK
jgi:Tfp pilus assembly major pilin PilA